MLVFTVGSLYAGRVSLLDFHLDIRVSDNLRVCAMRTRQQGYHGLSVSLRHGQAQRGISRSVSHSQRTLYA